MEIYPYTTVLYMHDIVNIIYSAQDTVPCTQHEQTQHIHSSYMTLSGVLFAHNLFRH